MSDEKDLASNITKVLEDDCVRKINFHLGGLHVSGDGLGDVAGAIGRGDIKVARDSSLGPDAEYDAKKNTLTIKAPDFENPEFRSLIVHESVHALIDMGKAKDVRSLTGEAAAYLAQAIYLWHKIGDVRLRANTKQQLLSSDASKKELGRIYETCLNLISRYKLAELTKGRTSVFLPPSLYQHLLEAIKGHGVYQHIPWEQKVYADGIEARSTGSARPKGGGSISRASGFRKAGPVGLTDSQESSGGRSSRKPGPTGMA